MTSKESNRPISKAKLSRAPLSVTRIHPAYAQVANQLSELIVGGVLKPGDRLPTESDLAVSFGVSRSTVREALRVLSTKGLVRTARGVSGGTFVAEVDPAEISEVIRRNIGLLSGSDSMPPFELLEARQLLEVPAAALAAKRRTDADIEALRSVIKLESSEGERTGQFERSRDFHATLLDSAGNRLLELMTSPLFGVIRSRYLREGSSPDGFWRHVSEDHQVILEHVIDQNSEMASLMMKQHLDRVEEFYESLEGDLVRPSDD